MGTGRGMEMETGCDAQRAYCAHLQERVNTLRADAERLRADAERLRADETDFFKGQEFERAANAKAMAAEATDAMDVAVVVATKAAGELQELVNKIDQMQLPPRGDAGGGASASPTHYTCAMCRKSLESTCYSASQLRKSVHGSVSKKGKKEEEDDSRLHRQSASTCIE